MKKILLPQGSQEKILSPKQIEFIFLIEAIKAFLMTLTAEISGWQLAVLLNKADIGIRQSGFFLITIMIVLLPMLAEKSPQAPKLIKQIFRYSEVYVFAVSILFWTEVFFFPCEKLAYYLLFSGAAFIFSAALARIIAFRIYQKVINEMWLTILPPFVGFYTIYVLIAGDYNMEILYMLIAVWFMMLNMSDIQKYYFSMQQRILISKKELKEQRKELRRALFINMLGLVFTANVLKIILRIAYDKIYQKESAS